MTWPAFPLAKLAIELQPGFAQQPNREEGGLPHLRTNNVSEEGHIDLSAIKTILPNREQREKYSLQPFDILFNNTNSPALVGKTALFTEKGEFLFSNHMTRIRVRPNLANPSYIARYLHWVWKTGGFRHMVTQWVSQAAINRTQLTKLHVSLPPLAEQRRIVEILDQADAFRKKRAEADAKADRILPALFYKMFGVPTKNNSCWEETSLGEFSLEFRYGTSTKCGVEPVGLPVLRIPNVIGGEVDLSDLKYAALSDDEAGRLLLEPGDILFVRTNGNPSYVGRCAIFDLVERYVFASYLIRARIDLRRADPRFVTEYLRTSKGRRAMAPYIRTTAGQSNISVEGLRQIPILLPPLSLQRQFGGFADIMRASRRKREQARNLTRSFFDSTLHHAFTGDLTARWRESRIKELLAEMEAQERAPV